MLLHRTALLTATIAAALGLTSVAQAASRQDKTASATVAYVAAHTVEGWADTGTFAEDEALMAAGGRIRVGCSNQAILAARALIRRGIPARLIQGASLDPAAPSGDYGHSIVEGFVDGRWQVYDVTFNVKPVLPNGAGMSVERYAARLAANQPIRFVRLANDDGVDWTNYPSELADIGHTRTEIGLGVYGFDKARLQQVFIWTASRGFVFRAGPTVGAYVMGRWPTYYHWLGTAAYTALTSGPAAFDRNILAW